MRRPGFDYAKIVLNSSEHLENITIFALTTLTNAIEAYPAAVMISDLTLPQLVLPIFKGSSIVERCSVLSFLCKYIEVCHCNDTIEIFTSIMESVAVITETYIPYIEVDSFLQNCYVENFQTWLIQLCDVIVENRSDFLKFKSVNEQELFLVASLNAIYSEFIFSKETKLPSIIEKFVATVDDIMFHANFTDKSGFENLMILMKKVSWEISEIFPLIKYIMILELEKSKQFDCKVTNVSNTWTQHADKQIKFITSQRNQLHFHQMD